MRYLLNLIFAKIYCCTVESTLHFLLKKILNLYCDLFTRSKMQQKWLLLKKVNLNILVEFSVIIYYKSIKTMDEM